MTSEQLEARNRAIVERINAGEGWRSVAKEFRVSKSRLGQILLEQRGKIADDVKPLSAEERMWISLLASEGVYLKQIARLIGRHETSVKRALKSGDIKARSGVDHVGPTARSEAVRLVREGHSYGAVANMLGISRNVVAGAVHRWKEKQDHDDVPKLSELQRRARPGQSTCGGRERHPEKAGV